METKDFARWIRQNNRGEELRCKKNGVYVLSCGMKTYTWLVKEGVLFTAHQNKQTDRELANTVWQPNDVIHSFDNDIMLPFHALTDSVLIGYNSKDLNKKIQKDAELSWHLAEHYHNQFRKTLINFQHSALDTPEAFLAYTIDRLSNVEGLKGEKISDATLSYFLSKHRISVNRLRNKGEPRTRESDSDDDKDAIA